MAAEPRRLAQLPGYDTAPDVYETPDPHDDGVATGTNVTVPGATIGGGPATSHLRDLGSETDDSGLSAEDEDHEDDNFGVSRRRLYPARARSRFGEASRGVETSGADLSDRVDGRRKGYRVRRRKGAAEAGLGDGVDGEGETLQMRIARLRREVEECRVLAEKNTESEGGQAESPEGLEADAKALNQLLAQIDVPSVRGGGLLHRRTQQPAGLDATAGKSWTDEAKADLPTAARSTGVEETLTEEQSLSRIAAFDARLASLEAALGLSALDSSGAVASYSSGAGPVPILPALSLLDAQFATLSSAGSLASLEAASAKIAALKHEARTLAALQQSQTVPIGGGAARAGLTTTTHGGDDSAAASEYGDAEEAPSQHDPDGTDIDQNGHSDAQQHLHATDLTTLRALYTHLPTLQALTPTLPALLTRLRSLRALHTTAGAAAADLEALERRQETLDAELATWRAGLERVEAAVREADQANGRNGTVVKGWVEGLEKRVEGLMMGSGGAKTG